MPCKFNIAMVTDYYFPSTGGIETHIRHLAKNLIQFGHKVIVITHRHTNMEEAEEFQDIKVYKLNLPIVACNTSFPSLYSNFHILKKIFEIENIEIVHGHATMSNLCLESLFHARTLNLKTVMTEHSIFEEGPFENVIVNSFSKFIFKTVDRCICVSKTSQGNFIQRNCLPKNIVKVIPNAVKAENFYPNINKPKGKVVIILSRLFYRKGIDLLIKAIPLICQQDKEIKILIAGEGPKRDEIEQIVDENQLSHRVQVFGEVKHQDAGKFLRQGDIFLNTSLTETFCLAILEASMCGLHVVSTNVGGIHEVLPKELITFAKPTPEDLALKVIEKAADYDKQEILKAYEKLKTKYSWKKVAQQTVEIYREIEHRNMTISDRLGEYNSIFEHFLIILEYVWFYAISIFCRK
ncbi:glycosyltransferase [Vairimorpha necatrix]|uniref:Glycosyltransferase n=1 Tax=Vairimorpha necatrix TaxID=6039 RepID=A0AAX4J8I8_9MICR